MEINAEVVENLPDGWKRYRKYVVKRIPQEQHTCGECGRDNEPYKEEDAKLMLCLRDGNDGVLIFWGFGGFQLECSPDKAIEMFNGFPSPCTEYSLINLGFKPIELE